MSTVHVSALIGPLLTPIPCHQSPSSPWSPFHHPSHLELDTDHLGDSPAHSNQLHFSQQCLHLLRVLNLTEFNAPSLLNFSSNHHSYVPKE
ncbi:hypothetical protein SLA2020_225170 [Shorea laevis]